MSFTIKCFAKYNWYIILVLLHIELTSCTKFTIVYDLLFHQQLENKFQSTKVDLIPIKNQHDNLQNITLRLKKINKDDVVILFTKYDSFFQYLLTNQHLVLSYGMSIQDMQESLSKVRNSYCLHLNQSLRQTLTSLLTSFRESSVAVVTGEEECAKTFYLSLKNSISNHQNSNCSYMATKHIIYNTTYPSYQENSPLNILKSFNFTFIVLLIDRQYVSIILREGNSLGLTLNPSIWLIPSYQYENSPYEWCPEKILSFQIHRINSNRITYKQLHKGVFQLINQYEKWEKDKSSEEIANEIYQTIQNIEEESTENLQLNILYRDNLAESWTNANGEIDQDLFYISERHVSFLGDNKMNAKFMRAVTVLDEPWAIERKDEYDPFTDTCNTGLKCQKPIMTNNTIFYETSCCLGYTIDILKLILEYTGIQFTMHVVEDGKYGSISDDGDWNGLIGDLVDDKADVAVGGLSVTKIRTEVVDFTEHLILAHLGTLYRPQLSKTGFINFEFVSPLTEDLEIALLVAVVVTIILVYFFENSIYFFNLKTIKSRLQKYFSVYESMTYVGGVTLQRDLGGMNPSRGGARMAAVSFAFCMVAFVSSYTAILAAKGIQSTESNPFSGLKDERMRNPTEEFKFATVKDTSYEMLFKHSENLILKKMSRLMEKYGTDTAEEGVKKIANGDLGAFIYDYSELTWLVQTIKVCELKVLQEDMFKGILAFAVQKNFKWTDLINNAIRHYHQNKEFSHVYHKWFPSGCITPPLLEPKSINDFGGLILILCMTSACCVPVLLIEHIYKKLFLKNNELRRKRKTR